MNESEEKPPLTFVKTRCVCRPPTTYRKCLSIWMQSRKIIKVSFAKLHPWAILNLSESVIAAKTRPEVDIAVQWAQQDSWNPRLNRFRMLLPTDPTAFYATTLNSKKSWSPYHLSTTPISVTVPSQTIYLDIPDPKIVGTEFARNRPDADCFQRG